MKHKKGNKKGKKASAQGGALGRWAGPAGKALLMSASYQIFAVGMGNAQNIPPNPGPDVVDLRTPPGQFSTPFKDTLFPSGETNFVPRLYAQVPDSCPPRCAANTGGGSQGYSNYGGGYSGPSQAEIQAQQQRTWALQLKQKGDLYYNKGEWDQAINYYEQALKTDPNNSSIHEALRQARAKKNFNDMKSDTLREMKGIGGDEHYGLKDDDSSGNSGLKDDDESGNNGSFNSGLKDDDETETSKPRHAHHQTSNSKSPEETQAQAKTMALNDQGTQLLLAKQWKEAMGTFQEALDKSPGDETSLKNFTDSVLALTGDIDQKSAADGNIGPVPPPPASGPARRSNAFEQAYSNMKSTLQGWLYNAPETKTTGQGENLSGGAKNGFDSAATFTGQSGVNFDLHLTGHQDALQAKWQKMVTTDPQVSGLQTQMEQLKANNTEKIQNLQKVQQELNETQDTSKKAELTEKVKAAVEEVKTNLDTMADLQVKKTDEVKKLKLTFDAEQEQSNSGSSTVGKTQ